ncbi:hypothetical protein DFJ73DRAFT_849469 [Zopfochytrium polystomum]|nr:hypothetical protein DFJ73DRAFT_849469 [Zopfochytrium polystomum]
MQKHAQQQQQQQQPDMRSHFSFQGTNDNQDGQNLFALDAAAAGGQPSDATLSAMPMTWSAQMYEQPQVAASAEVGPVETAQVMGDSGPEYPATPEKQFQCTQPGCTKFFTRMTHMKRHVGTAHFKQIELRCYSRNCERTFSSGAGLERHFHSAHQGEWENRNASPSSHSETDDPSVAQSRPEPIDSARSEWGLGPAARSDDPAEDPLMTASPQTEHPLLNADAFDPYMWAPAPVPILPQRDSIGADRAASSLDSDERTSTYGLPTKPAAEPDIPRAPQALQRVGLQRQLLDLQQPHRLSISIPTPLPSPLTPPGSKYLSAAETRPSMFGDSQGGPSASCNTGVQQPGNSALRSEDAAQLSAAPFFYYAPPQGPYQQLGSNDLSFLRYQPHEFLLSQQQMEQQRLYVQQQHDQKQHQPPSQHSEIQHQMPHQQQYARQPEPKQKQQPRNNLPSDISEPFRETSFGGSQMRLPAAVPPQSSVETNRGARFTPIFNVTPSPSQPFNRYPVASANSSMQQPSPYSLPSEQQVLDGRGYVPQTRPLEPLPNQQESTQKQLPLGPPNKSPHQQPQVGQQEQHNSVLLLHQQQAQQQPGQQQPGQQPQQFNHRLAHQRHSQQQQYPVGVQLPDQWNGRFPYNLPPSQEQFSQHHFHAQAQHQMYASTGASALSVLAPNYTASQYHQEQQQQQHQLAPIQSLAHSPPKEQCAPTQQQQHYSQQLQQHPSYHYMHRDPSARQMVAMPPHLGQ